MRILRLAGVLLATLAVAAGCSEDPTTSPSPAPTPTSSASATPTPGSPGPGSSHTLPPAARTSTGVEGLEVRYLDADGKVKTLAVKDFPR